MYAGINVDFHGNKGEFHGSYSPVRHLTLSSNFLRVNSSFTSNDFTGFSTYRYKTKGHLWEAAVGGYYPVGYGTFAVYAGYGAGRMRHDYDLGRIADLRIARYFVQPSFTYKSKWFRLGLAFRLAGLHYPHADIDYRIEQNEIDVLRLIEADTPFFMTEFGGNIGFYIKPITIFAHGVLSTHPGWSAYNFDATNIGAGIGIDIQDISFKKEKKVKGKHKRK